MGTMGMGLSYLERLDEIESAAMESAAPKSLRLEVETFLAANLSGERVAGYRPSFVVRLNYYKGQHTYTKCNIFIVHL
jgi:hypothetical protein